jgi:iduronate 2-sulfatase
MVRSLPRKLGRRLTPAKRLSAQPLASDLKLQLRYPTLVDLCSLRDTHVAHALDGQNLLPLLHDTKGNVREAAVSYWRSAISIRTNTHRLIADHGGETPSNIELYDIQKSWDPVDNCAREEPGLVEHLLGYVSGG